MTTYTNPFTGQTVSPAQVSYESLSITVDTYLEWPINGNTSSVVANIVEITTGAVTGLSVYMPSAQQVSVGQASIIKNTGSNPFTVKNALGGTIITIDSGISQYIYVTNNATSEGTWSTVTFGAGTSSANASALAGYGLTPINTTLNQSYPSANYYSSQTLTLANRASFVVWDSGVGTLTLPPSGTAGNGWFAMISNNGTGILTVAPQGTDTIDGNVSTQLQLNESYVVVCNGTTGYNTFGYGQSTQFSFTQLAVVVTGGTLTETPSQASNIIQQFTGNLTSAQFVVIPSTVQLYTITNNTTGAFPFTIKTSAVGGATVTIAQSSTLIVICDGTNVYNATSGSASSPSSFTSITLGNGSAPVPSLKFTGDLTTGIYLPSSGTFGFSVSGAQAGYIDSTGLYVFSGIRGGTF